MEFLKVRGSQVGPKTAHTAEEHSALHAVSNLCLGSHCDCSR